MYKQTKKKERKKLHQSKKFFLEGRNSLPLGACF